MANAPEQLPTPGPEPQPCFGGSVQTPQATVNEAALAQNTQSASGPGGEIMQLLQQMKDNYEQINRGFQRTICDLQQRVNHNIQQLKLLNE